MVEEDWIIITKQLYKDIGLKIKTSIRGDMYDIGIYNESNKTVIVFRIPLNENIRENIYKLLNPIFRNLFNMIIVQNTAEC